MLFNRIRIRILPALFCSALAYSGLLAAPVAAQEAPQPSRTTATYGSWTVECYTPDPVEGQEATAAQRCEMQTKVRMQVEDGTSRLIMQMAIGVDGVNADYWIVFQTPLNVRLQEGVKMYVNPPEGEGAELPEPMLNAGYLYCEPTRCLTQSELSSEQMAELIGADAVQVRFIGRKGRAFVMPLELDGFAAASAALNG